MQKQSAKQLKRSKRYTDSQKLDAVKLWLTIGNLSAVAAALNIPMPTMNSWRYSTWWPELVDELKSENSIKLSAKLQSIADRGLFHIQDRIENGDFFFDHSSGELKRKPVTLRDLTQAHNALHDRAMRVQEPKNKQDNEKVMDRLQALAQKFEEIATKKQPLQVTDVMFVEQSQT